jgi:hypothetical protein
MTGVSGLYDRIGGSYRATRRPDLRIAALIDGALGDARSVVNVGAGTGAYEPTDREVLAVEPSDTMIAQRPCISAPVIQASAEQLPLPDQADKNSVIVETIEHELQPITNVPFRLPNDCCDGVFSAYWGRPEMYLDKEIRRNISNFALAAQDDLAEGLARLEADIKSGAWDRRYGHLRSLPELDLGHRLLIAELT